MAKKIDLKALRAQIAELAIDKDLKHQLLEAIEERPHYGLVWEESSEEAWDAMQDKLPVFVEDANKRLDAAPAGSPNHVLIEGDNLNALAALSYSHAGKIDVIYIDPPYNTGNKDFVYNDSFVDKEDGYRHSKWLSFMDRRLRIAKKMLSEKGVVFISIDDNEQAQLKMLCDEIFGERNFIAKFDWRKKTGANDAKDIAVITESILLYSMSKVLAVEAKIWNRDESSRNQKRFKFSDEFVETRGKYYLDTLDRGGLQYSDSMNFGIEAPDGGILFPNGRSEYVNDGWIWKWGKEKVKWGLANKFLEFVKSKKSTGSKYTIKYKVYENVDNEGNVRKQVGRAFSNLILEPINQQGNSEMSNLFDGEVPFSNPKPLGLIKYLLNTIVLKDSTILDFFAGSGTTLHATMQLNSEDGGHRKCILVTNNENNICEKVTCERNKRVIQGYTTPKGEQVAGLSHNKLRYYKTEFVPRWHSNRNRHLLMSSLVDLLCIKNDIYQEQETFGGKRFKKSVLRYFKDEAGQMLVILNENVVSTIVPMIAEVATKQHPLKVYVYADGPYAYVDEFKSVLPVIDLCALPDAFLQALENDKDILPEQKYSEAMIAEFQQNQEIAEHDKEAVAEALSDDYDYLAKPESDGEQESDNVLETDGETEEQKELILTNE